MHGSSDICIDYAKSVSFTDSRVAPHLTRFAFLNKQDGANNPEIVKVSLFCAMPSVTPPSRNGYEFNGYFSGMNGAGTKYYNADGSSAHTVDFNTGEIYAHWTPVNYTISYNLNGGSASGNPSSYNIESSAITLNNPSKTGHTFKGWSGTGLTGDSNTAVTIPTGSTGNRSYTANWTVNTYTITYVTDGTPVNQATVNYGSALPQATTSKQNYYFVGWVYTAAGGAVYSGSTMPDYDLTATAQWIKPANDDSYVVDMGSGTKLNVLGNDASTATLNPVSSGSDDYNLSIADNQIVFKATSAISAPVTFNYSVTYNNASYIANVTVIPATSVYYEEDFFETEGTWTDAGTAVQNAFATIDDAYGYDEAYDSSTASYSMGTAKKATVSKTNTKGPKAQFTFTGTGFEVYSLTSSETGLVVITIKQGDTQILKTMVNTYFGNAYGQLYLTSD
ncbi:MAG: InlB B-repeat-containing protein, partial [Clostridia bacterium]|nr:InlB B-repeat-containing protein [Clostridia bacterium]